MGPCHCILISALIGIVSSQRPPYAGRRPIGYPSIETTTSATVQNNTLGNRFGENNVTTTTQRLPVEALGDRELVNRLGQLPQDKQPFWYLNWQALEANRNTPQTYPQKPNIFAESIAFPSDDIQNTQNYQQPIKSNPPQLQNSQGFSNNQQPLQTNQVFVNPQQQFQPNQGFSNSQQQLNGQDILNTEQPFQNQGFSNRRPLRNNQGFPNNQQAFRNNQGFPNNQGPFLNNRQIFRSDGISEYSDEFDNEGF